MTTRPTSVRKRTAVLAAAEEAFLATGYDAVTMDQIADRSGVAKQTVYAYFGSKEGLFVELVTSMTREAGDRVHQDPPHAETIDDVRLALENHLTRQLDIVLTPRLLQLRRLVIGEVARFPALARALAMHGPHRAIGIIAEQLRAYADRGLLRVPDEAVAAAQLNWLVMGEPMNDAMLLGDEAVPPATARRAHVRRCVDLFLAAHRADIDR